MTNISQNQKILTNSLILPETKACYIINPNVITKSKNSLSKKAYENKIHLSQPKINKYNEQKNIINNNSINNLKSEKVILFQIKTLFQIIQIILKQKKKNIIIDHYHQ